MPQRRVEALMDYAGLHTLSPLRIAADIDDDDQSVTIKLEHLDTALLERFLFDVLGPSHQVFAYGDENAIPMPVLELPNRYSLTIDLAGVKYGAYVCKLRKQGLRHAGSSVVLRPKAG